MSEMVERIFERIADNHVAISGGASADDVRELARVIIAAMREPTRKMGDAAVPAMKWKALGGGPLDPLAHASEVYRIMIDAALK